MKFLAHHFLISVLIFWSFSSYAQAQKKINPAHLLGSWALDKQVFLKPNEDSLNIKKEAKGSIITFQRSNHFLTQKRVGKTLKPIGTGTYKLDIEGKHLYQNDADCEIVELTDKKLVFKIEAAGMELHFKKLNSLK